MTRRRLELRILRRLRALITARIDVLVDDLEEW
jgi:hypothetical protein